MGNIFCYEMEDEYLYAQHRQMKLQPQRNNYLETQIQRNYRPQPIPSQVNPPVVLQQPTKNIVYTCKKCFEGVWTDMVVLECQHCYHPQCLSEYIEQQISDESKNRLNCFCGLKINARMMKFDQYGIQTLVFQKQLQTIREIYKTRIIRCQVAACPYFCFQGKKEEKGFCPLCLEQCVF